MSVLLMWINLALVRIQKGKLIAILFRLGSVQVVTNLKMEKEIYTNKSGRIWSFYFLEVHIILMIAFNVTWRLLHY